MTAARPFLDQLLHYFDRPHVGLPDAPVGGAGAWRGEDLVGTDEWIVTLTDDQVADLDRAATTAADRAAAGGRLDSLTVDDVPLPIVGQEIERWRHDVSQGRGFLLVRGLPVDRWSGPQAEAACWILGLHLGVPGAQNADGDLLGHVVDLGDDANHPASRLYRTNHDIRFHCDAADVVGLLCRQTATEGGLSRLVSSVTVMNELLASAPEHAARLFEPVEMDNRLEAGREPRTTAIQPCCFDGKHLRTFMHTEYFGSVGRHDGIDLDPSAAEAIAAWEAFAERPDVHLSMALEVGDLQLVSNHTVVHARTGYVDDPDSPRELLRLWLSLEG